VVERPEGMEARISSGNAYLMNDPVAGPLFCLKGVAEFWSPRKLADKMFWIWMGSQHLACLR
jgi:hypothetical protein